MSSPSLPEAQPDPVWVDGLPTPEGYEVSEIAWPDDMEGLYEFGLDPWLAERLRLDSETAEVSFSGTDRILDELTLD